MDETGFQQAMEAHRLASGAGETFGALGGEDVEVYRRLLAKLQDTGQLSSEGVGYNPYARLEVEGPLLALLKDGQPVELGSRRRAGRGTAAGHLLLR